jgi:hypothetical protein
MPKIVLKLFTVAALYFSAAPSQVRASTVLIDASTGGSFVSSSNCPGGTTCIQNGYETPIYDVNPGDTIDLGSVTLFPTTSGAFQGRYGFVPATSYEGVFQFAYGHIPFYVGGISAYSSCFTLNCVPAIPPTFTERLLFTIPSGATELQLAFSQGYEYSAPSIETAVPEASTWAMLLIGFAGIGFASYRKRSSEPPDRTLLSIDRGLIN